MMRQTHSKLSHDETDTVNCNAEKAMLMYGKELEFVAGKLNIKCFVSDSYSFIKILK